MIEREHALVATPMVEPAVGRESRAAAAFWMFVLGFIARRAGAVRRWRCLRACAISSRRARCDRVSYDAQFAICGLSLAIPE